MNKLMLPSSQIPNPNLKNLLPDISKYPKLNMFNLNFPFKKKFFLKIHLVYNYLKVMGKKHSLGGSDVPGLKACL